jgi:NADP-dependent 3-hydroxy acid dehydrogenase YdfG
MSRLVFITGASSGIGQALALRFYESGYRLALVARRSIEIQLWAQVHSISSDRYKIYSADVAVIDSIVAAGQACMAAQGLLDEAIATRVSALAWTAQCVKILRSWRRPLPPTAWA